MDKFGNIVCTISIPLTKNINNNLEFIFVHSITFLPENIGNKSIGNNSYGNNLF